MILVPVLSYGTLIAQQAVAFFDWLRPQLEPAAIEKLWRETLPQRYPLLVAWVASSGGTAPPPRPRAWPARRGGANHYVQVVLTGLATASSTS